MNKFYMVMRDDNSAMITMPTVRHSNYEVARTEAIRLAKKHPGVKFIILASIGHHVTNDTTWEEHT